MLTGQEEIVFEDDDDLMKVRHFDLQKLAAGVVWCSVLLSVQSAMMLEAEVLPANMHL